MTERTAGFKAWIGPGLIAVVFVLLSLWSWRQWPDPLIDFGRELYTPWQLSRGKVLYKDIATAYGPFSSYLNALLFKLFGVSLTTLIVCNLAILAGITAVLYNLVAASFGRLTATGVSLVFLTIFGFSQYMGTANYNFVCPYSHEATHGVACALLMLYAFRRWLDRGSPRWAALAGICLGITLLTKPEVAVAVAASAGAGVMLIWATASVRPEARRARRALMCAVLGTAAPLVMFFVYFAAVLPLGAALRAVFAAWAPLLSSFTANVFYAHGAGLDQPWANLDRMLYLTGCVGGVAAVAVMVDAGTRALTRRRILLNLVLGVALFAFLIALRIQWLDIGRALPALTLAAVGLLALELRRSRSDRAAAVRLIPLVMWGGLALVLMFKILLYTRVYHYGFYLAMPAALLIVVVGIGLVPRMLSRRSGGGGTFLALAATAIGTCAFAYLNLSTTYYQHKHVEIGSGGDHFRVFDSEVSSVGPIVQQTLDWIDHHTSADATMVVLPEGVMLNYLARRVNPTPYILFIPPVFALDPESTILAAFGAHPPDFVILAHRDTEEFGVGFFGADLAYGKTIMDWVTQHYREVALFGAEPFRTGAFGIKVLQHAR